MDMNINLSSSSTCVTWVDVVDLKWRRVQLLLLLCLVAVCQQCLQPLYPLCHGLLHPTCASVSCTSSQIVLSCREFNPELGCTRLLAFWPKGWLQHILNSVPVSLNGHAFIPGNKHALNSKLDICGKAGSHLLSSIWVRCGPKDHLLELTDRQSTERADHYVLNKLHDCEKPYSCTCMLLSVAFVWGVNTAVLLSPM